MHSDLFARRGASPISVHRANNLFCRDESEDLFGITEIAWNAFVTAANYHISPVKHTNEHVWLEDIGRTMFPEVYRAAKHWIRLPSVVTQCDSWLSVLSNKYSSRQASIGTCTVANQMFLRGNMSYLPSLDKSIKPIEQCNTQKGETSSYYTEDNTCTSESSHSEVETDNIIDS